MCVWLVLVCRCRVSSIVCDRVMDMLTRPNICYINYMCVYVWLGLGLVCVVRVRVSVCVWCVPSPAGDNTTSAPPVGYGPTLGVLCYK